MPTTQDTHLISNYSEEILAQIEEMSAALMPPKEIAILLGLKGDDVNLFRMQCLEYDNTKSYEAYQRGRLTTKLELNKHIVKLAKAGSPQAEELASKVLKAQNL
ncbi:MAG: hypothetical protein ACRC3G_04260 [Bacteroidales bacterium]